MPDNRAGTRAFVIVPSVKHRAAGEDDSRNIGGRRRHNACGRCFVASGCEYDAVKRVSVKHFNQTQISEIAVKRGGRSSAGFLYGMCGELHRDSAGGDNAIARAFGELQMNAIARREVAAALGDTDNGLARLQLFAGHAIVEITLQIKRRHIRALRIIKPLPTAQLRLLPHLRLFCFALWHCLIIIYRRAFVC